MGVMTPIDETQRRLSIEAAIHSTEMEGGHVTAEFRSDARDFIDGTIDARGLVNRTRIRYGL